jgi:aspartate/methionine/tyrosine aminotransferase
MGAVGLPIADRMAQLQRNVFADMDQAKAQSPHPIIDLSLGSSDLPTPDHVLAAIAQSLQNPATHGYLLFNGTAGFRHAVANWYGDRYGVKIDAETEVLPLIGSQEGTAHLPLAVLNPGEYALLMDPGYPSHSGGVALAGGQIYPMKLTAQHQYLPQFDAIPEGIVAQAKLMVLSYPHNPTTAIASLAFFKTAVAFCQQHGIVLAHDFPYADLVFDGNSAPSVLQADPDKTTSIEFFTFSKSYNMGGFRLGFALGNAQLIKALRQVKAAVDFNQYLGILNGGIAALQGDQSSVQTAMQTFRDRRDALVSALNAIGWSVETPKAAMYLWAKLPKAYETDSIAFCQELVIATGVALSPGVGFGSAGEGYVRFALVQPPEVLAMAVEKIGRFLNQSRK